MEYEVLGLTFVSENLNIKTLGTNEWLLIQEMNSKEKVLEINIKLNCITYRSEDGKIIFDNGLEINYPYIEDFNGNKQENCYYNCNVTEEGLKLVFDNSQLEDKEYTYPLYIKTRVAPMTKDNPLMVNDEETEARPESLTAYDNSQTEIMDDNNQIEKVIEDNCGQAGSINRDEASYASDVTFDVENKEILVRKRVNRFVEQALKYLGEDVHHDDYKEITYRERACKSEKEIYWKNTYDAFIYLISDYVNPLTSERLNKFIYLVSEKVINEDVIRGVVSKYFELKDEDIKDKLVELYKYLIEELKAELDEKEAKLIVLMVMNYCLVNNGYPLAVFNKKEFKMLDEDVEASINEVLKNNYYQTKEYYKNLTDIHYEDIEKAILENKELFVNEYKVKELYVFGSFSKGKERFDSDIDLLIKFNLDITSAELANNKNNIRSLLLEKLHRNVDINELVSSIEDEFILELQEARKVL